MALIAAPSDRSEARRLQRRAERGQLRRLYTRVYTDDLVTPLETVTRRELYPLCAQVAPGAIVSYRSALESRPSPSGFFFLIGAYRRDIKLPGVTLRIVPGPGPLPSDIRIPTFLGDIFISSQARALLENLTASRGADLAERRTLGDEGVEAWLDRFISRDLDDATNRLRDMARAIAEPLGLQRQFARLDSIIGALLGTRTTSLTAKPAIARAAGRPYDGVRLELFDALLRQLNDEPLHIPPLDDRADSQLQAFVESYFSNFIEGTEFEIEEAHDIVVRGRPLKYREDDSHDILGTYGAILESKAQPRFLQTFDSFLERIRQWNRQVIESRLSCRPGEFKTEANRAGNTYFVAPELVIGTLEKGYERIMSGASAGNRAALAMFIVAEVHPFTDGNGRTARLAMNSVLSEAGLTRVIIPTVYRDDYISALKAMSGDSHPLPLSRMLTRAAQFSRWIDLSSRQACFGSLRVSHALDRPEEGKLSFDSLPALTAPAP